MSCVNGINDYTFSGILNSDFKTPDNLSRLFQWSTIFIECVLPFGILHHKTRKYAVVLLLLFHSYLALSFYADFSATAIVLLLGCVINFNPKEVSPKIIRFLKVYLIFIIFYIISHRLLKLTTIDSLKYQFYQGIIFNTGFLFFIFHYFKNTIIQRYFFQRNYFLPLAGVFLLISIWTLRTYIGLGNQGNLTMFSNLVTEKSMNNHWLIDTKKTKIFDFEEDNVYIISMETPFSRESFSGHKLPLIQFKFLANYWSRKYNKPIPCTFIYKGEKLHFEDIRKSPFTKSKWWYKYVLFRKIQATSPNKCRW